MIGKAPGRRNRNARLAQRGKHFLWIADTGKGQHPPARQRRDRLTIRIEPGVEQWKLARLGYSVTALTGKESEAAYLGMLGAKDVLPRKSLDLAKIKPLDRATWAGAVDNLGGEVLAWMASTMMVGGTIAAIGLAASMSLNTTVAPFILRGVSLLGIDSGTTPMPLRREVWRRLATDLRPAHLKEMTRTIPFDELPKAFDGFIQGAAKGRIVVDMAA